MEIFSRRRWTKADEEEEERREVPLFFSLFFSSSSLTSGERSIRAISSEISISTHTWDGWKSKRNVEIWHSNTSCVNESKTKNNATNDFVPVTGYEERRERKGVLKGTGGG